MRQVDDDNREAELEASESAGVGCLLVAIAILVAIGGAMWLLAWYFKTMISFGGCLVEPPSRRLTTSSDRKAGNSGALVVR